MSLVHKNLEPTDTPLIIYAEGHLGKYYSKAAMSVLRYGNWPILAVIDSTCAGKTLEEITGIAKDIPIVASFDEALGFKPKALLIGVAYAGGALPDEWHLMIKQAINNKLHVLHGFHSYLNDDLELKQLAQENDSLLWDVRNPELYTASNAKTVAKHLDRPEGVKVVTLVGSDCSSGKMTTALELTQAAQAKGIKTEFIATGQNGIMIKGDGIPIDGIVGDFMAGSIENAIFEAIKNKSPELIFVEGQGSLIHPGFSGVTLSLLHGSNPDAMILCHKVGRDTAHGNYKVRIPSLSRLIEIYEEAASWTLLEGRQPAKVIGIALNTSSLSEAEALAEIEKAKKETGLNVVDPVRFASSSLLEEGLFA